MYCTCLIRNVVAIVAKRPMELVQPNREFLKKVGYISTVMR